MTTPTKVIELEPTQKEKPSTSNNKDEVVKVNTPNILILFLTEALGTATLMFLGCMGVCVPEVVDVPVVPHFGAIGFGLTVLLVIQAIGHVSGAHLNPQVTLAALILGKLKYSLAPVYLVAEFLGAALGFGLLKLVVPCQYTETLCDTAPQKDLTLLQALVIESVITGVLAIVCGAVWDPRNVDKSDSVPLRFGFIIACISIAAGPFTGASMNTARSFAPALINGNWNYHWIYWVGPTVGSAIGSLIYKLILSTPQ